MSLAANNSSAVLEHEGDQILRDARGVLRVEAGALEALAFSINDDFVQAVRCIQRLKGRLIVSGIGKSGHIARKIAATLASTGQPSFFVHAGEASHGDLGMITKEDGVLILSFSGETVEIKPLLGYARRLGIPVIGLTKKRDSALGLHSDFLLLLPEISEACPMGLAPTTSTTMMLAIGDALAVSLLKLRGFSSRDYVVFHPGGSLGQQLTTVGDKMHKGRQLPLALPETSMSDVLVLISEKGFGCVGIVDEKERLLGIITDGDLRRFLSAGHEITNESAYALMTRNPITVTPNVLMAEALHILQARSITSLFIIDEDKKPIGLIHIHDFLKSGVL